MFLIISGSATLRTPKGLEIVNSGDLIFFEKLENGAHQLYNHTSEPCVFLDIRTYIGYDIAAYPDSHKVLMGPSFEISNKEYLPKYFDGEPGIKAKWQQLQNAGE